MSSFAGYAVGSEVELALPLWLPQQPVGTSESDASKPSSIPSKLSLSELSGKQEQNAIVESHPRQSSACPEVHATLPLGVLLIAGAITVAWITRESADSGAAEAARSCGLFVQFCGMTNYSIVFLEAYRLSKALLHDAAFSGQLIGIYMGASCFGGLITSTMLWGTPDLWKTKPRQVLLGSQILNIVGFCIYAWVNSYLTYNVVDTLEESKIFSTALLFARVCSGIGHGISATLLQISFAHLTPAEERPAQMTRFLFVCTLGIGLGPMIAAGLNLLDFCDAAHPMHFELIGQSQLVLAAMALFSMLIFYPHLDDVHDYVGEVGSAANSPSPDSSTLQTVILVGCMICTFVRAMVTSGVEGATSLLLETEYGFPQTDIGIIIGGTFLFCLPMKCMIDLTRKHMSVFQWIRLLSCISIVGSIILFRRMWYGLVIADVLLFPSLYLSDGMVRGVMQQNALPSGTCLDQTGTTFWAMVVNSLGRFMGPWFARWLLQRVQQTGYAILQVLLAVAFWAIFEFMIVTPIRHLEEIRCPEVAHPPKQTDSK
jgi:hypothetical protein